MKINESIWFCKIIYIITLRINSILKVFWMSYDIDNNWKIVEFIYIISILRDNTHKNII